MTMSHSLGLISTETGMLEISLNLWICRIVECTAGPIDPRPCNDRGTCSINMCICFPGYTGGACESTIQGDIFHSIKVQVLNRFKRNIDPRKFVHESILEI